jgi:hypothetical protein
MGIKTKLVLYVLAGTGSYIIARKFTEKPLSVDEFLKKLRDGSNSPVPVPIINWKTVVKARGLQIATSRAIQISLGTLAAVVMVNECSDQLIEGIIEGSPALLAEPASKLGRVLARLLIRAAHSNHGKLKEILLSPDLSQGEKLAEIKVDALATLEGLKGPRRTAYLAVLLGSLVYILGNNSSTFEYFFERLKYFFADKDIYSSDIEEYLRFLHDQNNAPYPDGL